MRSSIMEVNLSNFRHNINSIRDIIPKNTKMMPIIKSNAYGTYINTRLDIINEFDIVAVALVCEGEKIRKSGYKKEIFVLNQPDSEEIDEIINNNLTIGIADVEFVKMLGSKKEQIKVHIEVDTGMGRTGVQVSDLTAYMELIKKYENIVVEGVYTHFSSADLDMEYTKKQIKLFKNAIGVVKSYILNLKYIHAAASNGLVNFPEAHYNLVRPGMIMYGYESGDKIGEKIDLKPVCKLKSKITFLKIVEKGTSIGYGRSFQTEKNMKVATVPIGYADGLKRALSNQGEVCINGMKAPIIGKVCMDSIMVDVSHIENVKVGDDVWVWDNETITLEEIASCCNTINYEIMSTISDRVPRVFTE